MKSVLKMLLIPMCGAIAMTLIFVLVVWGGSWEDDIVDENREDAGYGDGLVGYAVMDNTRPCSDLYDPVCGHNGITYGNSCKAVKAGTKTAYQGVCLS